MKNFKAMLLGLVIGVSLSAVSVAKTSRKLPMTNSSRGTDLPILQGTLLEIISYDSKTKTYEVRAAALPGEGESFVTPEALAEAAPNTVSLDRLLKNPNSIVGQQFQLTKALATLFDEERDSRKAGAASSPVPKTEKKSQNSRSGTR